VFRRNFTVLKAVVESAATAHFLVEKWQLALAQLINIYIEKGIKILEVCSRLGLF